MRVNILKHLKKIKKDLILHMSKVEHHRYFICGSYFKHSKPVVQEAVLKYLFEVGQKHIKGFEYKYAFLYKASETGFPKDYNQDKLDHLNKAIELLEEQTQAT